MSGSATVSITRGTEVESRHVVHIAVSDGHQLKHGWGDAERLTMPRSAIKSVQVLPLLTSGAADAWGVTDDEVALACSSHGAEPRHIELVASWLHRIGYSESNLECGPSDPITKSAADKIHAAGITPGRIHNCCSGKHTGFLTLARHLNVEPAGYLQPDHPVQVEVTRALAEVTGVSVESQVPAIDGCGIPVYSFPLSALANGLARLVRPYLLPDHLRPAGDRVVRCLPSRAFLVSGTGRAEQVLTDAATEAVILKGGAEGVFMGALPDRGIGFALKAEDGAQRAVDAAARALLGHLGVLRPGTPMTEPVRNRAGDVVGQIETALS